MTVRINNTAIPATMRDRALNYLYQPGLPLGRNGMGEVLTAGGGIVTWTWAQLNQSEFTWWVKTILGGRQSVEISGAVGVIILWDDTHVERSFYHGIVLAPQYQGYSGFSYLNVTIKIDTLY